MTTVVAPRPLVEAPDPALAQLAAMPPVEQVPPAPVQSHHSVIHDLLHHRTAERHTRQLRDHTAAREAGDAAADYDRITTFLGEQGGLVRETARQNLWALPFPALFGMRVALAARRHHREHPEQTREFAEAVSRRVGALAVGSAQHGSRWLVDRVHDVDWWELAKWATQNDEIRTLANVSVAAGPYGRAARAAFLGLEAAVAYHEAPERGHSRMPALFGAIVSHALHAKLKSRGEFSQGQAATEELLRRAAQLRAMAAKAS